MKKSLLLGLMTSCVALSASALEEGEFVNTPKARYQITGAENLCLNGTFADGFTGWTAISATEGAAAEDQFTFAAAEDEKPAGIVSVKNAPVEGISYSLNTLDPNTNYVVSMVVTAGETAANTANFNTRLAYTFSSVSYAGSVQMVNIIGTDGDGTATEYGFPTEIKPGKNVLCWAIPGDGVARDYVIKLAGWDTSLRISDVEIREAQQVADPRTAQQKLDYVKAVRDMYEWDETLLGDLTDNIDAVDGILAEPTSSQEDLDAAVADLDAFIADFLSENADDQLSNALDKLPKAAVKVQKRANIGNWWDDGLTTRTKDADNAGGRIHSSAGDYYDLGHFQFSNTWGNGSGIISLTNYGLDLIPGTYIFSVDLKGNCREFVKNAWEINEGLEFADAILTVKDAEGTAVATTDRYALDPARFTKNWLVFKVENEGKYDIVIETKAKEAYASVKSGSVVMPYGASLYAVTAAEFSKAQLDYEIDVRGQITAGRTNITSATTSLADETKSWGKADLQNAVTTYEPVIAEYEKMDQKAIIATYDKTIYDASQGLEAQNQDEDYYRQLASEVYRNATKQLIAANKAFKAQNDTINMLTTAITNANTALNARIYSKATGKSALNEAITTATNTEKDLRALDYSLENAQTVKDAISTLNQAVTDFKASVPAEAITSVVDMDGALVATLGESSYEVSKTDGAGKMVISNFNAKTPNGDTSFGIGYLVNEENPYANLLRVGNGNGTVDFNVADESAILQMSFDIYFGNLSGKSCGFRVQKAVTTEPTEEGGETTTSYEDICGLVCSKYSGTNSINTFGIDYNANITAVGRSGIDNASIAAESNKTHFDIVMDLATKKMSCTIKNSISSEEMTFEGIPSRFVLESDYNNADRRSFFGGLTIKTIAAEADAVQGVAENAAASAVVVKAIENGKLVIKANGKTYNAAGALVK